MNFTREIRTFLDDFGNALDDRTAAFFIGAGLSIPAGFKSWIDLIKELAEVVGLDHPSEVDYLRLAQFYFNQNGRNRSKLSQKLKDMYDLKKSPTKNHELIASLPVETVWTTNYDSLIEDAFNSANKVVSIKRKSPDLALHDRGRDVTVYKMHGDVGLIEDVILTKDDYEKYSSNHEPFITALKGDLVSKKFLFLGFSFADPNIDYIISRVKFAMGDHTQTHYCIMKWPDPLVPDPATGVVDPQKQAEYDYSRRRQVLLNEDLLFNNIHVLMIDDWNEITDILAALNKRAHNRNIFVSGSAKEYGTLGEKRVLDLARAIGERIINENLNLVSGFGAGIAEAVLNESLQTFYRKPVMSIADRVVMLPFPQYNSASGINPGTVYTKHREDMLANVGYAIFIGGNREDSATNTIIHAPGVLEEFNIAKQLGIIPIPIGATEYASKQIWDEVVKDQSKFFGSVDISTELNVLGDDKSSNDQLIDAVFSIIKKTKAG